MRENSERSFCYGHHLKSLIPIKELPSDLQAGCKQLIEWGLLASFTSHNDEYVGRLQLEQLQSVCEHDTHAAGVSQLFPSDIELNLTGSTSLTRMSDSSVVDFGGQVLVQLLPEVLRGQSTQDSSSGFIEFVGTNLKAFSKDPSVISALRDQRARVEAAKALRAGIFARSAHYMGSKQALTPLIGEILRGRFSTGGTILDLMCGSGAASGYFARQWNVLASDAQRFSRLLALVQGGGFSVARARSVLTRMLEIARDHLSSLEKKLQKDVEFEERILSSEFTDDLKNEYVAWVAQFPRLTNSSSWLISQCASNRARTTSPPYVLFSAYYANLFFGVRQAIEIDSLRYAIDQLGDAYERDWALGALVCAVSACADNHGGHFAQPRVKLEDAADIEQKLPKTLFRRSLSVFQEFSARFLSLAEESASCAFSIGLSEGPWQEAIAAAAKNFGRGELLVYLDPPYTRDEYSRYYHVLETLVLYNYPSVSGRALVPEKGSRNRFSSEFFTRVSANAARIVSEILRTSLRHGWPVLWSYADSGIADMRLIIEDIEADTSAVELFSTKYLHSNQGRKGRRDVREYFVYLAPR